MRNLIEFNGDVVLTDKEELFFERLFTSETQTSSLEIALRYADMVNMSVFVFRKKGKLVFNVYRENLISDAFECMHVMPKSPELEEGFKKEVIFR